MGSSSSSVSGLWIKSAGDQQAARFAGRKLIEPAIARCAACEPFHGELGRFSISGVTSWLGQMPMEPKEAESTSSRPVMSRVHCAIRSLLTRPMCDRS